jgi:hypothetical protein
MRVDVVDLHEKALAVAGNERGDASASSEAARCSQVTASPTRTPACTARPLPSRSTLPDVKPNASTRKSCVRWQIVVHEDRNEHYNDHCAPSAWTATADVILDKISRFWERTSGRRH